MITMTGQTATSRPVAAVSNFVARFPSACDFGDVRLKRPVDIHRFGVDCGSHPEVILRVQSEDTRRADHDVVNIGVAGPDGNAVDDTPGISQFSKLVSDLLLALRAAAPGALVTVNIEHSQNEDQHRMGSLDLDGLGAQCRPGPIEREVVWSERVVIRRWGTHCAETTW